MPVVDPKAPRSIDIDGVERSFYFTAPTDPAAPLVVMLHGAQFDALDARLDYGWEDVAASEGIAVAYPEGIGSSWNAGNCCEQAQSDELDDVAFILTLVDQLVKENDIDPSRVYITGFSNGAMLAYRLACESDQVTAIAPVGGTLVAECSDPAPISVLAIHGDADPDVPLDGLILYDPPVQGTPIADLNAFWRSAGACAGPTVTTKDTVTTSLADCPDGRQVGLITVAAAGHQWPGSLVVRSGVNATSDALDATSLIWDFFARHPRR